jgi:IS30 family transposase
VRAIADALGRAPSTISRELSRGVAEHDRDGYDGGPGACRMRGNVRVAPAAAAFSPMPRYARWC